MKFSNFFFSVFIVIKLDISKKINMSKRKIKICK